MNLNKNKRKGNKISRQKKINYSELNHFLLFYTPTDVDLNMATLLLCFPYFLLMQPIQE